MTPPPASGSKEDGGEAGAAAAGAADERPPRARASDDVDAAERSEPRSDRSPPAAANADARDEIFTWEAPHATYALGWSNRADKPFRLAVGSFVEDYPNRVDIVTLDEEAGVLRSDPSLGFEHPFPPTRVAFVPDRSSSASASAPAAAAGTPDLLATSGDFLRIWKIDGGGDDVYGGGMATDAYEDGEEDEDDEGRARADDDDDAARRQRGERRRRSVADAAVSAAATVSDRARGTRLLKLLNNNKHSEFCAPLTSFDWNEADARRLGTASIDTTCTIWDVERGVVDTQLIAHDREVFDIAWGGVGVFASVSADGSVRVFDLRDKEHSTIIYESTTDAGDVATPLLRLAWNRQDPRYMACLAFDSSSVAVLDIRFPAAPVASLARHAAPANALAWAPHSSCHICTAGDDAQALIWDLSAMARPASVVSAGYNANGNNSSAGGGGGGANNNETRSFGGAGMTPSGASDRGGSRGNNNNPSMSNNTTTGGGGGGGGCGGGGNANGAPSSGAANANNATTAATGSALDPILAYSAGAEICGLQWSSAAPDWVAICFANKMQILRV